MRNLIFYIKVSLLDEDTNRRIHVKESDYELIELIEEWYKEANKITDEESTLSFFSINYVKENIFRINLCQNPIYNFEDSIIMEMAADPDEDGNHQFRYRNKSYIVCGSIKKNMMSEYVQ